MTDEGYVADVVMLSIGLGFPTFIALWLAVLLLARWRFRKGWFRAVAGAFASVATALMFTFVIWIAFSVADVQVPENIFMIGGWVNSFALAACLLSFIVTFAVMNRGANRGEARPN